MSKPVTGNIFADDTLFPWFEGHMLQGKSIVRIVHRVTKDVVFEQNSNEKKQKLVLRFYGTGKGLILSKTNIRRMADMYGPNVEAWVNQPVTLYAEEVMAFGEEHLTVRIMDHPPATVPDDQARFLRPVTDDEANEVLG